MSAEDRRKFGKRVEERVWQLPGIGAAKTILLYASLPEEVPTDGIAAEARARGMEVVYPRCLAGEMAMSLHLVGADADLIPEGRYGLREPASHCPITEVGLLDVALVPGLAWDRAGNRVGRGAGYYDRLLSHPDWRAMRCGLFFSAQEFPSVPTDAWDWPLDAVVTEREVLSIDL